MGSVGSSLGLPTQMLGGDLGSGGLNPDGLGGILGGNGQNAGLLGVGQFRTDPYHANAAAFAPNADEQAYIRQLQGYANGTAPSAAQIQMQQGLQQASGQAQALAASQRGVSPALAARFAAQQQAGLQQNIAGQTSQLRAQEQAGAMGQLGDELRSVRTGQMGLENLNSGNQNFATGANLQGYTSAAANRGNAMSHVGNALQGGALMGAKGGMATRQGFQRPQYYDDGGEVNSGDMNKTPSLPSISAPQAADSGGGGGGGGGGGIMSMLPMLMALNSGGEVPSAGGPRSQTGMFLAQAFAAGGEVDPGSMNKTPSLPQISAPGWNAPQASGGGKKDDKPKDMTGGAGGGSGKPSSTATDTNASSIRASSSFAAPPSFAFGGEMFGGGLGAALGSPLGPAGLAAGAAFGSSLGGSVNAFGATNGQPAQKNFSPVPGGATSKMGASYAGQQPQQPNQFGLKMDRGGKVPGKAEVDGDSLANDKVPAMLSPKEIVIPRSITLGKNAGEKAKAFVEKILASHNKGKK